MPQNAIKLLQSELAESALAHDSAWDAALPSLLRVSERPRAESPLAHELAEIAAASHGLTSYRRAALALLQRRIGFDWGIAQNTRAGASGLGCSRSDSELGKLLSAWALECSPREIELACAGRCLELSELLAPPRMHQRSACRSLCGAGSTVLLLQRCGAAVVGFVLSREREPACFLREERALLESVLPVHALAECLLMRHADDPLARWAELHALTVRQRQIVELVIRGLTNDDVAAVLHCSAITVRNHLVSVFRKAEVANRSELVFQALTHTEPRHQERGSAYFERHALAPVDAYFAATKRERGSSSEGRAGCE